MSGRSENEDVIDVTRRTLRSWPLPEPGDSKYSRGRVAVLGGSENAPGAVALAGLSALRVGAGRLSLLVPRAIAIPLAIAVPEAGVFAFDDELSPAGLEELTGADAVLIGPGLTDATTTRELLRVALPRISPETPVILDAFALGVLPDLDDDVAGWNVPLILTPNREEAALLLGQQDAGTAPDVAEIARTYAAVVSCYGVVCRPDGQTWRIGGDNPGLATSGSGDVLAGAILGLAARVEDPAQAVVWGTFLHVAAGDALLESIGSIGYLARELSAELPRTLHTIT